MRVEVLYFDGCPAWLPGVENLKAALDAEHMAVPIELVKIRDEAQAQAEQFLGSPSFRVDGRDLWPDERTEYTLDCRVYATPNGLKGWPTVEMLRERLKTNR